MEPTPHLKSPYWKSTQKVANYAITGQDTQSGFHNSNASTNITLTLPKAIVGGAALQYKFLVSTSHAITVTPKVTTDTIRGFPAGTAIPLIGIGTTLHLECWIPGFWEIVTETTSAGGQFFTPTLAELTVGVTIINFQYAPGYVDRYIINVTPGTTDTTTGFNSAAKVANALGCEVRFGATAPYRLNSTANFTVLRGVVFRDESSANLSNNVPSLIIGHNGIAFDFAGSVELTFHNIVFQNAVANVPQAWLYTGRVAGAGCGLHRFYNCRSTFNSKASWAFYGVGSEENNFYGCTFYQNQGGSGIISHNVSNPANILSTFVTVGAGVSGTENHHYGFGYYQLGNSGSNTETIFQLDQASNTTIRDGTWGNAHGMSYISVVGAGAITNLTLDSIRGEPLGTHPLHGVFVANTAGINTTWVISNVTVDASGYLLNFNAAQTPSIQNLTVQASTSTSGSGVLAYSMSNSEIQLLGGNTFVGQVGGTVSNNIFKMWRSQATFSGTANFNTFIDNNTGTIVTQSIGLNNNTAPGQSTGWGTPTNGAVVANYNATAEGNTNSTKAIAQIIFYLKSQGAFGT